MSDYMATILPQLRRHTEELAVLYDHGWSTREFGEAWGVHKSTAQKWLRLAGVRLRPGGNFRGCFIRKLNSANSAHRQARLRCPYRPCVVCLARKTDVHHKDSNPFNNAWWNLERRCRRCNMQAVTQRRFEVRRDPRSGVMYE